ncbi:MAG: type II secretion system protein [Verrucomicrobiales bacterium]|nr:type II secretion system protein [Verrucomicrobiales bacterium]
MKIRRKNTLSGGFSLVELLVVISIIVILASLIIASLPGIQNKANRNQVQNFMAELESGLEKYQIDHGIYPQNPSGSNGDRDSTGIEGAKVLYQHLSGDYLMDDGKVDPDEKIYVLRLDYWTSERNSKNPRSVKTSDGYTIVDTYGSPVRYIADPPNISPEERKTFNPTYDLWSTAGNEGDPDDFSVQANYITNWQSK